MPNQIVISPVTRIEGHAEITIDMEKSGKVKKAWFSVQSFRGFEKFLEGMPADDIPQLTCRICGICYSSHGLCSVKAIESAWGVTPSPEARKVRELLTFGQYIESHALSLAVLSLPDFIYSGYGAEKRNFLNMLKNHENVARKLMDLRQAGSMITSVVGGRAVHPINVIVGGMVHVPTSGERKKLLKGLEGGDKILMAIWKLFKKFLLPRPHFMSLGSTKTCHLGLSKNGNLEFYDWELNLMNPQGDMTNTFPANDYYKYVTEEECEFSYMKFPVLTTGEKLRVGPLSRVNIAKNCGTPVADELLQEAGELLGFPTNTTMAYHVARLIETVHAWEKAKELLKDDDVSSHNALGGGYPPMAGEGIGIVEAPRGVLVHHYVFDDRGKLNKADFVVATQHNSHAINDDLTATARESVSMVVNEDLLNRLEMIPRAYDPCLGCATHLIGDRRPFGIRIRDHNGKTVRRWERDG